MSSQDVIYSSGFIRGRLVSLDDSEGFASAKPGLMWRCRASEVVAYEADVPNVLAVYVRGMEGEPRPVFGTIQAMDKAMQRAHMMEIRGGGRDDAEDSEA